MSRRFSRSISNLGSLDSTALRVGSQECVGGRGRGIFRTTAHSSLVCHLARQGWQQKVRGQEQGREEGSRRQPEQKVEQLCSDGPEGGTMP